MIKNVLRLSLHFHSFSFSKYNLSFLGKWDLGEQTGAHHLFFRPLLHRWTRSPCLSFIYNDFVNSVTECPPPHPRRVATQPVTQPNPIKWLLMNFKQVLSPSSTCAMLQHPPTTTMQGLTLSPLLLFHPRSFCLFDMLKLLLSHMLNGIFSSFSHSVLLLFLSLILPILLPFSTHHSSVQTWNSLGKCFSLFTIFTLVYITSHHSLLLVSHLSFLLLYFPLVLSVFHSSSFFSTSLSISFPPHTCFLSPSSFRQVIGALYLGCYSNLNWLAVNFRPPIAKWLIPPLSYSHSRCHSFVPNYCTGRNQPYFDPSVTSFLYEQKHEHNNQTESSYHLCLSVCFIVSLMLPSCG